VRVCVCACVRVVFLYAQVVHITTRSALRNPYRNLTRNCSTLIVLVLTFLHGYFWHSQWRYV